MLKSPEERNAVIAFLVAGALSSAISFLIPLYIQIVQGDTPLFTAVAIVPYALAVAAAAILSVRLYGRMNPRLMGAGCFILNAIGFALVALTISQDWGTLLVIIGLMLAGIGEGTMLTLLFNVLVSASPKEYAGDVGALRGVVNNVSSALGAAFAGVVAVTLLTGALSSSLNRSTLPPQFNLDNFDRVDFVSDAQLKAVLATTSATPAQIDELMRINQAARDQRAQVFVPAPGLDLPVAIFPAMRLPRYRLVELDAKEIVDEADDQKTTHRADASRPDRGGNHDGTGEWRHRSTRANTADDSWMSCSRCCGFPAWARTRPSPRTRGGTPSGWPRTWRPSGSTRRA